MIPPENLTDSEVINIILKGESQLYETIIRRYNPYLYKIGRSYNLSHEDTQDMMQDTFVDAYKGLAGFEGRSSFKTWIIRIMMNNCYKKKEKASFKNEILKDVNDQSKPIYAGKNDDTSHVVANRELAKIIEDALVKIRFDYRMVFSLREINGLSVAETASLLNISESNVKVRLNRAKSMLRTEIEKSYSLSDLFDFNLIYCDAIVKNVMQKIYEL